MKSRFVWIAEILLVILIFSIIVYFDYHIEKESSHVAAFGLTNDKVEHNPSNNNTVKSPSILINSTNTSNCIYPTLNERNSLNLDSSEKHIKNSDTNGSKRVHLTTSI